jgi:hypothetical protein
VAVDGRSVLDAWLPGGAYRGAAAAGWRTSSDGRTFSYRNGGRRTRTENGIRQVVVRVGLSKTTRATVRIKVAGKDGAYPVAVSDLPLKGIVVLDTPLARTGQCAEGAFAPPKCKYDTQRGVLRCEG